MGSRSKLLTLKEASDQLGLKYNTLRFWIWKRKIEYIHIGGAVRISQKTVDDLILAGTVCVEEKP